MTTFEQIWKDIKRANALHNETIPSINNFNQKDLETKYQTRQAILNDPSRKDIIETLPNGNRLISLDPKIAARLDELDRADIHTHTKKIEQAAILDQGRFPKVQRQPKTHEDILLDIVKMNQQFRDMKILGLKKEQI